MPRDPAAPARARRALPEGAWAVLPTLALLGAMALDANGVATPSARSAFRDRVRAGVDRAFPYAVGDWVAKDEPVSDAARDLLRPDALVSRSYRSLSTGESASLSFVLCGDARDLIGHHPPVCYPARGLRLVEARERDWRVAGRTLPGVRYRFAGEGRSGPEDFTVDSFVVLPGGEIGRGMDAVERLARDPRRRTQGAAAVQVITQSSASDARRDEVLSELLGPAAPLLTPIPPEESDE